MKFSLIAAVVVLALAQGSFAEDAADLEKLTQYFENMKASISERMTELMNSQDFAGQAENIRTKLQPMVAQMQENYEANFKPIAENLQAQAKPVVDNIQQQMEAFFQKLTEQAKAIAN